MKPYVMFGIHPLFGEYVDAIHAAGGFLARAVLNVQEPERPTGRRFEDGLDRYHRWLEQAGMDHRVQVLWLDEFIPSQEETPVIGFRGTKVLPLVERLRVEHAITFPPLIHPRSVVSPMSTLEEGVFVGAGAVVASHTRIGAFTLINRGATIGHDADVDRCVVVGPSASAASGVHLCEGCVLGIGCTVIEDITIGANSYVAAGTVVLNDVSPGRMVAGVPAVDKRAVRTQTPSEKEP
jgi:sugar O-acyltransferase (sialic acid O-acetyltransferase NeuD family)